MRRTNPLPNLFPDWSKSKSTVNTSTPKDRFPNLDNGGTISSDVNLAPKSEEDSGIMLLEYRNLYQSCKYTVLDSNYYAIPDFLWFSFPKQSKTMVHLLKIFCRGYINAGKYTSPIERFGYGLGCEIPSLPPQKNHHICIFQWKIASGKSWFWDYPQKDPSPKKDIPEWVFPMVFSTSLRNYAVCTSGSQRSLQCCMSIWRTPRVGGYLFQLRAGKKNKKNTEIPHVLNSGIFECSLYSLNMFERKILAFHLGCSLS